jgi:Protein of unknown function (DUF3489)
LIAEDVIEMFYIDQDGCIGFNDGISVQGDVSFRDAADLLAIGKSRGWGKGKWTAIWNSFAGAPPFGELKELKCFRNSGYAVERIWSAIQRLAPESSVDAMLDVEGGELKVASAEDMEAATAEVKEIEAMKQPKKRGLAAKVAATLSDNPKKPAKKAAGKLKAQSTRPKATASTPTAREGTKKAQVIAMVSRKQGASVDELMELLGTQHRHSVRGLLSTLASKGFAIVTEKDEKRGHVYRAA